MIKFRYLLPVVVFLFGASGCNQNKIEELEQKNEELSQQLKEMDSNMNSYLLTISEVEDNLTLIKEKQNLINSTTSGSVEFDEGLKERLVNDLRAINSLMTKNREKIDELQEMLKNSNFQIEEFRRLVARVNQKLVQKDREIHSLTSQLEELALRNETLDQNITFLTIKVDTLSAVNEIQSETILNQKKLIAKNLEELSSGFVATGTLKELEERNIIRKEGGILGVGTTTTLNREIDKDDFLRIDINKTQTIPLMVKKVKVITNHPLDSYMIEESENGELLANLVITDPDRFWNTSKFLVVRVN